MKYKKITGIILAVTLSACSLVFTSCDQNAVSDETSTGYEYKPSESSTISEDIVESEIKEIKIDNSWKYNFRVNYRYYNPEQSITTLYGMFSNCLFLSFKTIISNL